ncbi:hypothetical protein [Treponema sp.]|uniref:hypothetical protein n=1 Tax=Treponema sp. TaxID=166 RepID=UPI00298E7C8D|nr:hypothetical protein [Treponema sp.]MCQ2242509.1 hypothetical protein [Treponema sp.]
MERIVLPGILSELMKNSMKREVVVPARKPAKRGAENCLMLYFESVEIRQIVAAGMKKSKKKCIA